MSEDLQKIDSDTPLMEGIAIMQGNDVPFDIALQLIVDLDKLQHTLSAHAMTGQIYDLREQPLYLLAMITLGWFRPELMGIGETK